ncbi:MAG: hypothetical protein QME93_05145 [Bacillota bacterium]|nr:hypothetical protein [Bacillota bacterium]
MPGTRRRSCDGTIPEGARSDLGDARELNEQLRRLAEDYALVEQLRVGLQRLWERGVYTEFTEVLRSEEEAARFHPLYLDMAYEAILLYDRDGFFASLLAGLRERLAAMGAKRRRLGRITYWDLKPDFRPGEVIEF